MSCCKNEGIRIFIEYFKNTLAAELIKRNGDDADAIFLDLLSELHRIFFLPLASKFLKCRQLVK